MKINILYAACVVAFTERPPMRKNLPGKLFDDEDISGSSAPQTEEDSNQDDTELTELRAKNTELEEKVLRLYAEFENEKRRNAEGYKKMSIEGARRLLDQLLPSLDTLDLALSSLPADIASHPWTEGLRQFEKLLQKALTEAGLKKIEITVGETHFDPQFHEAIGKIPAETVEPGTISQAYQQGYLFQDSVLRTAKVQVAD